MRKRDLGPGLLAPAMLLMVALAITAEFIPTGCASLGLAPAQSFEQRLAYAYGTHTAVLETAAGAVHNGSLTQTEGAAVLNVADQSRQILDAAKTVYLAGDKAGADKKLVLAVGLLQQVQSYLQSRGIK